MLNIVKCTHKNLEHAATLLLADEPVVVPTETVYGIAANASSDAAVAKIYKIKNRPNSHPLILHFANLDQVEQYFNLSSLEQEIAHCFWPGPLTLLTKSIRPDSKISKLTNNFLPTFAIRVSSHIYLQKLINLINKPLAAPSANNFGKLTATLPSHINFPNYNGKLLILDGGKTTNGIESTIIATKLDNTIDILRHGAITQEDLQSKGFIVNIMDKPIIGNIPGNLESHYQPNLPIRLNVKRVSTNEALLGFGMISDYNMAKASLILNLSPQRSLQEAGYNLFDMMWQLDNMSKKFNYTQIAVMPIPHSGLGRAINERLIKASFESSK